MNSANAKHNAVNASRTKNRSPSSKKQKDLFCFVLLPIHLSNNNNHQADGCIRTEVQISSSYVTISKRNGGGERDRTDDLLNANQVLSQLSYAPINI